MEAGMMCIPRIRMQKRETRLETSCDDNLGGVNDGR